MIRRLGVVLAVALAIGLLAGCSISTAKVTEAAMSTALDEQGKSLDTVTSYTATADRLTVSAYVDEVSEGTTARFVWYYETEDIQIGAYEVNLDQSQYVTSYITMEAQEWPIGDYRVDVYIGNRPSPDLSIPFTVEEPTPISLDSAVMCTALNADNSNHDIVNSFGVDAAEMCTSIHLSGIGEEDIPVSFVWMNLDTEETLHTQALVIPAGSETSAYIGSRITSNGTPWELGRYGVGLIRQGAEEYLVFLNFEVVE